MWWLVKAGNRRVAEERRLAKDAEGNTPKEEEDGGQNKSAEDYEVGVQEPGHEDDDLKSKPTKWRI